MAGLTKRIAEVPPDARFLAEHVSKADLLEAAWHLASLCNDGEGVDDDEATLRRLHCELQAMRTYRGARALPALDRLRQRWDDGRARYKAMVDRWGGS